LCNTLRSTTQIKSYPQALSFVCQSLVIDKHCKMRSTKLRLILTHPCMTALKIWASFSHSPQSANSSNETLT
jgi:hypothetical protein